MPGGGGGFVDSLILQTPKPSHDDNTDNVNNNSKQETEDMRIMLIIVGCLLFLTMHYLHLGLNIARIRRQWGLGGPRRRTLSSSQPPEPTPNKEQHDTTKHEFWTDWAWHCVVSLILWLLLQFITVTTMSTSIANDKGANDSNRNNNNNTLQLTLLTATLCAWRPLHAATTQFWPDAVRRVTGRTVGIGGGGGPLGRHWSKAVDIVVGAGLYYGWWWIWPSPTTRLGIMSSSSSSTEEGDGSIPSPFRLGKVWDVTLWGMVAVLVIGVNAVLQLWTWWKIQQQQRQQSSRVDKKNDDIIAHEGVAHMVQDSQGRALSLNEHGYYAAMALANAICEEVSSRGLWRWAFRQYLVLMLQQQQQPQASISSFSYHDLVSNIEQSLAFGLWHYYGIPSGWTGVVLTTVYGFLMGALSEYANHGLALPIVAHTVADYYIFAIVARQQPPPPPPPKAQRQNKKQQ